MTMSTRMTTTEPTTTEATTTGAALYRLMSWLSPAYPLGAFSYSHGLEYAVEAGRVTMVAALIDWVGTVIEAGARRVHAALFVPGLPAAEARDHLAFDAPLEPPAPWRARPQTALQRAAPGA